MAIAAATETSLAEEVETEPDGEPDPELHLRGRSCRCPAANVKPYCEEGEWGCHTCGHQLSPRLASLLTPTSAPAASLPSRRLILAANDRPDASQTERSRSTAPDRADLRRQRASWAAHAPRPASSARLAQAAGAPVARWPESTREEAATRAGRNILRVVREGWGDDR